MPREWDSEGAPERRKKYLSTFVMACIIVFPWLLGYSFDTIDPGYVGLLWNQVSMWGRRFEESFVYTLCV